MTYTVNKFRYPHGREDEAMDCTTRDFEDLAAAVAYADRFARRTRGIYYAGTYVEDEKGEWVYILDDDGDLAVDKRDQYLPSRDGDAA